MRFKWNRTFVTPETYLNHLDEKQKRDKIYSVKESIKSNGQKEYILSSDLATVIDKSEREKAYEVASDIRKFEIELFWKRAGFFWAFIVAIYTAYFHVLTTIHEQGEATCIQSHHGTFPLLALSALGLFFCFSWLLSSYGSKHWQENWENHIDLLENEVTGPLFKTYIAGKAYSESKITIAAGWVVTVCSYMLLIYEFANMLLHRAKWGKCIASVATTLGFAIIIPICLFGYSVIVTGNTTNKGEISFQTKTYEDL